MVRRKTLTNSQIAQIVDIGLRRYTRIDINHRQRSRIDGHRTVEGLVERIAGTEMQDILFATIRTNRIGQIILIIRRSIRCQRRHERMFHQRDGRVIEIDITLYRQQGRIVGLRQDQRSPLLVISRCHLSSRQKERLGLLVEWQQIGRVFLQHQSPFQRTP